MATAEYDLKEEAYQFIIAEKHAEIDKEYETREKANDQKLRMIERQASERLHLKQKIYGGTEKENQDKKKADEINRANRKKFLEGEKAREKAKFDAFIEIQVFGEKGGRLKEREVAYGAQDSIVIELKEQKRLQEEKQVSDQKINSRVLLSDPHRLETMKGELTGQFQAINRDRER